jgi:hypothetical protein
MKKYRNRKLPDQENQAHPVNLRSISGTNLWRLKPYVSDFR